MIHFGDASIVNKYESLTKVIQIGTLDDYIADFETRIAQILGYSDE